MRDKLLSTLREASVLLMINTKLLEPYSNLPSHLNNLEFVQLKVSFLDPDLSLLPDELRVTLSFYNQPYFLRIPYRSILSFKKVNLS
jgi:hypothetical protein